MVLDGVRLLVGGGFLAVGRVCLRFGLWFCVVFVSFKYAIMFINT